MAIHRSKSKPEVEFRLHTDYTPDYTRALKMTIVEYRCQISYFFAPLVCKLISGGMSSLYFTSSAYRTKPNLPYMYDILLTGAAQPSVGN